MRTSLDDLVKDGKKLARSGIFAQIICAVILIIATVLVSGIDNAKAVFTGAMASIIPNTLFAFFSFRYSGARQANLVHKSTAKGMQMKLIFTALIFVAAFGVLNAHPVYVFSAYAVTSIIFWLAIARNRSATS